MSMQRVLETARKFGLPVIVTDVAGRDPMVMMPLEQFEALTEAGVSEHAAAHAPQRVESSEQEIRVPYSAESIEKKPDFSDKIHVDTPKVSEAPASEITIEEQFFLEPVDEEGSL